MTPDRTAYVTACPTCGQECKAWAAYLQATRSAPMKPLGYSGYCPECMGGFNVELAALTPLSVLGHYLPEGEAVA